MTPEIEQHSDKINSLLKCIAIGATSAIGAVGLYSSTATAIHVTPLILIAGGLAFIIAGNCIDTRTRGAGF